MIETEFPSSEDPKSKMGSLDGGRCEEEEELKELEWVLDAAVDRGGLRRSETDRNPRTC